MEFSEEILRRSRSPAAIFHRYRVDSSIFSTEHIFIEGYDDHLFYNAVVTRHKARSPKFHICYGKRNLDKIYDLFEKSGLKVSMTNFIRDSDFDVHLGKIALNDNMFLTRGYSVENYVCCTSAISALALAIFGVDADEIDLAGEVSRLNSYLSIVFAWMTPLHAAIFKAVSEGRTLDLDQLKFGEYFSAVTKGEGLPAPDTLDELASIGLSIDDFKGGNMLSAESYSENNPFLWMRGKYLIKAVSIFLQQLESNLRALHKTGVIRQFNKRVHPDFSTNILFERLTGYVDPDDGLKSALFVTRSTQK